MDESKCEKLERKKKHERKFRIKKGKERNNNMKNVSEYISERKWWKTKINEIKYAFYWYHKNVGIRIKLKKKMVGNRAKWEDKSNKWSRNNSTRAYDLFIYSNISCCSDNKNLSIFLKAIALSRRKTINLIFIRISQEMLANAYFRLMTYNIYL